MEDTDRDSEEVTSEVSREWTAVVRRETTVASIVWRERIQTRR